MSVNLFNLESERYILGALLIRPKCLSQVKAELSPDSDFTYESNRTLLKTFIEIGERGDPLELPTIFNELEKNGYLAAAGGKKYLMDVAGSCSTSTGLGYHIQAVKDATLTRRLKELLGQIENDLKSGVPGENIIFNIRDCIISLNGGAKKARVVTLREGLHKTIDHIQKLSESGGLTGVSSGFQDIDRFTGGWQPGELVIIAGRPGMGKSVIAKDFAEAAGVPVAYFSLEMSIEELGKRHLSGAGNIKFESVRSGRLNDSEWERTIKAGDALPVDTIHLVDSPNITIDELVVEAENLKMTKNIGLVVIDYLQLIRTKSRSESREREVADISRKLKSLARSLEVPVICLAQLNRQVESRDKKIPRLADLRESGAIEQDADIVAFLYRESMYSENASKHDAKFIIAKGRNVRTGTVNLFFDGQHQVFKNAIGPDNI